CPIPALGFRFLCSFAPRAGLVTLRQTFVRRCQDARSGGLSADAITAALAPADRTPTVLGDSGRRLVGARYAVVAARHPTHRAPLAALPRLRQLLGTLREGERRQQHSRDDQSFQHG